MLALMLVEQDQNEEAQNSNRAFSDAQSTSMIAVFRQANFEIKDTSR